MELQKLFMQMLLLSRVWVAMFYHVLFYSWIQSCVGIFQVMLFPEWVGFAGVLCNFICHEY